MSENTLVAAIKEIYESSKKPLYLANLGQKLESKQFYFEGKLRPIIEGEVEGFVVVQDHDCQEKIAIASLDDEEEVRAFIKSGSRSQLDEFVHIQDMQKLPKSLIFAFCIGDTTASVYLNTHSPFKYKINPRQTEDGDELVDSAYRQNIVVKRNLRSMSHEDLNRIWTNFKSWAAEKELSVESFYVRRTPLLKKSSVSGKGLIGKSLLEVLIESQSEELREKIVIPMNIVELLLSKKV